MNTTKFSYHTKTNSFHVQPKFKQQTFQFSPQTKEKLNQSSIISSELQNLGKNILEDSFGQNSDMASTQTDRSTRKLSTSNFKIKDKPIQYKTKKQQNILVNLTPTKLNSNEPHQKIQLTSRPKSPKITNSTSTQTIKDKILATKCKPPIPNVAPEQKSGNLTQKSGLGKAIQNKYKQSSAQSKNKTNQFQHTQKIISKQNNQVQFTVNPFNFPEQTYPIQIDKNVKQQSSEKKQFKSSKGEFLKVIVPQFSLTEYGDLEETPKFRMFLQQSSTRASLELGEEQSNPGKGINPCKHPLNEKIQFIKVCKNCSSYNILITLAKYETQSEDFYIYDYAGYCCDCLKSFNSSYNRCHLETYLDMLNYRFNEI